MKRGANFYRPRKPQALSAKNCELEIDGLSHDGRGLSRYEGKRVFVAGALPGERVRARIHHNHSRFAEAQTLEVLTSSAQRVTPRCPHIQTCGGCSLQHLDEPAQIEFKQAQLIDLLRRFAQVEADTLLPPLSGPSWGYRRRARLSIRLNPKTKQLQIGFRAPKSSQISDIRQCPVLDPRAAALLEPLRACLQQIQNPQALGHAELAFGDTEGLLLLRTTAALSDADRQRLATLAREQQIALYLQPNGPESLSCLWPEGDVSPLHYNLCDGQLQLAFSPEDFTQINAIINRQMVDLALRLLDPQPDERVLDLFCGLGNFTLPLALKAGQVVGVEAQESMVQRGRENARRNALSNAEFHAADLTQDCRQHPWFGPGFDKILLDPPRAGALEVVQQIADYRPKRLLYISCNPATLARDAGELQQRGYRLRQLGAMDMFPHTSHVEAIALFEPNCY